MTDWMNCCMVLQMDWIDEKIGSIGWKNLRKGGFSQSLIQSSISVSGLRNPRHLTLAVMPSGTGGAVVLVGVASCNAEGTCRTGQGAAAPLGQKEPAGQRVRSALTEPPSQWYPAQHSPAARGGKSGEPTRTFPLRAFCLDFPLDYVSGKKNGPAVI